MRRLHVPRPFGSTASKKRDERHRNAEFFDHTKLVFSPILLEKRIDRVLRKSFVGNLSLRGKLFEIYFVRLIGTPNQQFKNDIGREADIDVSSS